MRTRTIATATLLAAAACDRRDVSLTTSRGSVAAAVPRIAINEVMVNPRATPDERGEWIELRSLESQPTDLRGWSVASGNDRGVTIDRNVVLPANGIVLLARSDDANALGRVADFAYGPGLALGNGRDWIAVRLPDGRTVDSVAWADAASGASRSLTDPSLPHADLWS